MNENIQCIIIDDEPLARDLMRTLILANTHFNIVGECMNATEAYELLLNNNIDVIFLDIHMPGISGIDFLKALKKPPKIIFTTAYDKFAAVAFDLDAVDYIVKPVSEDRFVQALGKLDNAWNNKPIDEPADDASQADHVFFKADGKLIKVLLENILYLEALKDFTRIFLKQNKSILVGVHLKAIENLLPAKKFMRVHRSYSVFLKAITAITGNTLEIDRIQIPIGPSFKEDLYRELNIL